MTFLFRSLSSALITLTLVVFSGNLFASMIVDNTVINFQQGDPSRKDVKIKNPDMEPLYIQVEVKEVINPGSPDEVIKPVVNPKEAGFLVTPNKLVIQPGAEQLLRVVNLKGLKDYDRIFRITLKPVVGDVEAEQTGVKILVGYELLVLIQPFAPKVNVTHVREGNKLILENKGNTNVGLQKGTQCKDDTKAECTELPSYRLYAGNRVVVELKYDTPVNYLLTAGMSTQAVEY